MYKVKPEDVIPTRTDAQIAKMEKAQNGIAGAHRKDRKKGVKLFEKMKKLTTDMKREYVLEVVSLAYQIADISNGRSADNAVCVKGCSHCCQVNVDVTGLEAAYIEVKTGHPVELNNYNLRPGDPNVPYCPFHDDKTATCSIHEYRPIACRGFFTFDSPKLCIGNNITHAITNAWNNPATKTLMDILGEVCGNEVKDIRAYFKPKKGKV